MRSTILETLRGAAEACEALSGFTLEAAGHLRSGEIQEGNELLSGIVDDFSQLVGLLMDVRQFDAFGDEGEHKATENLETETQAMADLLKMAVEAQESQDWVFLADILEYEFPERLEAWNGMFTGLSNAPEASPSL
jgi:hypothetical protein